MIFHNAHVLVIIEVYFFIDLVENAGLARPIRKSLEESFLLFMEGKCVRIGEQSGIKSHFFRYFVKRVIIH